VSYHLECDVAQQENGKAAAAAREDTGNAVENASLCFHRELRGETKIQRSHDHQSSVRSPPFQPSFSSASRRLTSYHAKNDVAKQQKESAPYNEHAR